MPDVSETDRNFSFDLVRAAEVLDLLAHKDRLAMLLSMLEKECPVSELARSVGISNSQCSQFLARFRHAGIVEFRKEATVIYYRCVSPEAIAVITALRELKRLPPGKTK